MKKTEILVEMDVMIANGNNLRHTIKRQIPLPSNGLIERIDMYL